MRFRYDAKLKSIKMEHKHPQTYKKEKLLKTPFFRLFLKSE